MTTSWRQFQKLGSRYRQLQIQILEDAAIDLPDMSLKALCAHGNLLIKSLRKSHQVIRAGEDVADELEHWRKVRDLCVQQLTASLTLIEQHLGYSEAPPGVWEKAKAFEFVGTASAAFQEEALFDREQKADPTAVIDDDALARLTEQFGGLINGDGN